MNCECGYGIHEVAGGYEIRSHSMYCPALIEYRRNNPLPERPVEEILEMFDACGSGWIREELAKRDD